MSMMNLFLMVLKDRKTNRVLLGVLQQTIITYNILHYSINGPVKTLNELT